MTRYYSLLRSRALPTEVRTNSSSYFVEYLTKTIGTKSNDSSSGITNEVDELVRILQEANISADLIPALALENKALSQADLSTFILEELVTNLFKIPSDPIATTPSHKRTPSREAAVLIERIFNDIGTVVELVRTTKPEETAASTETETEAATLITPSSPRAKANNAGGHSLNTSEGADKFNPFPLLEVIEKRMDNATSDDFPPEVLSSLNGALRRKGSEYAVVVSIFLSIVGILRDADSEARGPASHTDDAILSLARSVEKSSDTLVQSSKAIMALANRAMLLNDSSDASDYSLMAGNMAAEAKASSDLANTCLQEMRRLTKVPLPFQDEYSAIKSELSSFREHMGRMEAEAARKYEADVLLYHNGVLELRDALDQVGSWDALLKSLSDKSNEFENSATDRDAVAAVHGLHESFSKVTGNKKAHTFQKTALKWVYVSKEVQDKV